MDVTCNRCGTVYEFEESLIASMGMTVKCTDCGHLFKVQSQSDPVPGDEAETEEREHNRWRLRRVDGSTRGLVSLADLTDLIEGGELSPDDEISRTGLSWKRLGAIAELAQLFETAPSSPRDEPLLERGLAARARATEPAAPGRSRRVTPARSRIFEAMGQEVGLEDDERISAPPPPPPLSAPPRARSASPPEALPTSPSSSAAPAPAPVAPAPVAPAPAAAVPAALVASDPAPPPAAPPMPPAELAPPVPRRSPWLWLLIAVPLGAGAAFAWTLIGERAPQPVAPADNPAREFLARADEALASHRPKRLQVAVSEYTKALAFHEDDAHILSSISRTFAIWAQLLRFRLEHAQAGGDANEVEVANLRGEIQRLAQQAKLHAEQGARRNPGNEEAEIALADALRLSGNLVGARAELDRARAHEGVASAESLRVTALLTIDEAGGDLSAGLELAQRAVEQDSTLIRTRLLLARCLIAVGKGGLAKMHIDAVRRVAPEAGALTEVEGRLKLAEQPEAAPAAAAPAATSQGEPPADAAAQATRAAVRGEKALERGAVVQARTHFEQALELSPKMPRALTGLGYVALELSQPRLAVRHFRKAKHRGYAEAYIGLGDAYRRLGRMEDALEAYEAYVVRFPRGDRRSIARRQIELLREQRNSSSMEGP